MSCTTYYTSVENEQYPSNMTASFPEDDEISEFNSSCTLLPTYDEAQKQFILLTSRDKATRERTLNALIEQTLTLYSHLRNENCQYGINSTPTTTDRPNAETELTDIYQETCQDTTAQSQEKNIIREVEVSTFEKPEQVLKHLVTSFLRLSMWCPFDDVRKGCEQALSKCSALGIPVPKVLVHEPSSFIPHTLIPPADTDDEQTYSLYVESYIQSCRLEHMVLIMGMHPQYLKEFLAVNMYLLKSDGALPYCYRSYIGILAAARHKCLYLVHLMETDFIMAGGDAEWLRGVEYSCPKLQSLADLNKLLAHRPWLVNADHIQTLCKGGNGWQWSQSELVQAIILLCHFHSLAIFCHGTGVNLEIDHMQMTGVLRTEGFFLSKNPIHMNGISTCDGPLNAVHEHPAYDNDIEMLMLRMQKLHEENEEEVTREEMKRRFEKQKIEAASEIIPSGPSANFISYIERYITDPAFSYQDFAKRSDEEIPTFRAMDFNWQDHAYSLISTYYLPVADMLDSKFNTAYNLTYNTLASKEHVDTSKLRRAIWMYLHCTCGIMFDDYNYGEVNQLLERSLKLFIKTASCFPELTTKPVYDAFWKQFRHSEKVHVNIVLLEGRFQVELLYALRALTEYIK